MGNYRVVVIDFETTGLSPNLGDRTIEVGAVLLENQKIVDRFQSLMNPEKRVPSFIENFTGITNKMLSSAPPIKEVMQKLNDFIGPHQLVAHNASFDMRFLDAELERLKITRKNEYACSLLTSRRIYQQAPDHKLETLVKYKKLMTDGIHHRALADAEMTAHLWVQLIEDMKQEFRISEIPFSLVQKIGKTPKHKVRDLITAHSKRNP